MAGKVRPIAICVFRHGDCILVAEGYDSIKKQSFYRPLGGTIEFAERSEETIRREIAEEIEAEVTGLRVIGTLENIFIYEGERGHEIVIVYDGEFVDKGLYQREIIEGDEFGTHFKAVWKHLGEFRSGKPPLYPDGLPELLKTNFPQ